MKKILFASTVILSCCFTALDAQELNKEQIQKRIKNFELQIIKTKDSISHLKKQLTILKARELTQKQHVHYQVELLQNGKLRTKPDPVSSEVIYVTKTGDQAIIKGGQRNYCVVQCNGHVGYINDVWIKRTDEVNQFLADLKIMSKAQALLQKEEDKKAEIENTKKKKEQQRIAYNRKRKAAQAAQVAKAKQSAERNAERKSNLIKKHGNEIGTKIYNKQYWVGMTRQQLIESLGYPDDINKTVNTYGTREQFIYPYGLYVYVQNGKVTSYQE